MDGLVLPAEPAVLLRAHVIANCNIHAPASASTDAGIPPTERARGEISLFLLFCHVDAAGPATIIIYGDRKTSSTRVPNRQSASHDNELNSDMDGPKPGRD